MLFFLPYIITAFIIACTLLYTYILYKKEREIEKERKNLHKTSEKMIEDADKEADRIIEAASDKAKEIVSQTEFVKKDLIDKLEKSLQEDLVSGIKKEYINVFTGELADFQQVLKVETVGTQKIIAEKINAVFEKAQQEIEVYKNKQFEHLDSLISAAVLKLAKEALGKVLTVDEQERLVEEALKQAKRDGIFVSGGLEKFNS